MEVQPGAAFEASYASGTSGLVGTLEVAILDNDGNVTSGPTSAGIIELTVGGTPIGVYSAELTAPLSTGQFSIVWSPDGLWDPISTSTPEELLVQSTSGLQPPPIGPPVGAALNGPCNAWTTSEDVAACCSAEVGSDTTLYDNAVIQASELLFELSGRRFLGTCEKTVRPCGSTGCGFQVLSRGHIVFPDGEWSWAGSGWASGDSYGCSCSPLDRILLSGYPVTAITEVKIDGAVVDPATYALHENRFLVRVADPADPDTALGWPSCQRVDLPDTESGTFSVTYEYGANPPALGMAAAAQLACEFYQACTGGTDCTLPAGTTRATRQGLTIDKTAVTAWAWKNGIGWQTGIGLVDAFLAAYNPDGLTRRAVIYSSSGPRYARTFG